MSYFDKTNASDLHVKDVVDNENVNAQLSAMDNDIESVCLALGVEVDDIPVDADGYLTSPTLKNYALYLFYHKILSDYWGGAGADGTDDIYKVKLEFYTSEMQKARAMLTKGNILNEKTQKSFISTFPMY